MKKNIPPLSIIALFLSPILSGLIRLPSLHAQTADENLWITNGQVNAIARSGNTIYIGGHFTHVGPQTGHGAAIDVNTGTPNLAIAKVNGSINAVVPDGAGGWYVGGAFTMVGGVARNNIAHIGPDGRLVGDWNPNANNAVSALAISGSTVYAGGAFTAIGGQPRNCLAALDAVTGTATSWNPNANGGTVNTISVFGSIVYAGGAFTGIGGQARNFIAALDRTTGTATSWNPNANSNIAALAVSGSTVYAGGAFTSIGGQTRNYLAALDATTGTATTWNPNANNLIWWLLVSGSTVYAGGNFTDIGNTMKSYFAGITASVTSVSERQAIPNGFGLYQNYPNPFNPSTTIRFSLPSASFVSLKIFDALGREVSTLVSEELPAGTYSRQWNAPGVSSGVYFYRLQAGSYREMKKLLLVR